MDIVTVHSLDDLRGWASEWNELAYGAAPQHPRLAYAWVEPYLEHRVLPHESWFCLFAQDDNRLVGVLPVVVTPRRKFGMTLEVLRTPDDPHTKSVEPVVSPDADPGTADALIDAAFAERPRAHWFEMKRLPDGSPTLETFATHSERRAVGVFCGVGAYIPVTGPFDDYLRSLSRNFRSNLKKAENKLARLDGVRISLAGDYAPDAAQNELDRFLAVEASGWKARAGSAIALSPDLVDFYRSLTNRLNEAGWLEWQVLEGDGKVLASNMAIRLERSLVIWRLGYLEDYSRCSPGSMLLQAVAREAMEAAEVREVNLLSDQGWYDNWNMHKRPHYDLWIYRTWLGRVLGGYYARAFKNALRRVGWLRQVIRLVRGTRSDLDRYRTDL